MELHYVGRLYRVPFPHHTISPVGSQYTSSSSGKCYSESLILPESNMSVYPGQQGPAHPCNLVSCHSTHCSPSVMLVFFGPPPHLACPSVLVSGLWHFGFLCPLPYLPSDHPPRLTSPLLHLQTLRVVLLPPGLQQQPCPSLTSLRGRCLHCLPPQMDSTDAGALGAQGTAVPHKNAQQKSGE